MRDSFLRVANTFRVGGEIDFGSDDIDLGNVRHWVLTNLSDQKNRDTQFVVSTLDFYCAIFSILDDIINIKSLCVYDIGDNITIRFQASNSITFELSFLFCELTKIVCYEESLTNTIYMLGGLLKDLKVSAYEIGVDLDRMMSIYADVHRKLRF